MAVPPIGTVTVAKYTPADLRRSSRSSGSQARYGGERRPPARAGGDCKLFLSAYEKRSGEAERIDGHAPEILTLTRHGEHPFARDQQIPWAGLVALAVA